MKILSVLSDTLRPTRLIMLLAMTCLLRLSGAQGYWSTTYSGGTGTVWTSGNYPYSLSNGVYGGGGCQAFGQITANFHWNSQGGGPPDDVYVLETCIAKGESGTGMPIAAAADNGLGSTAITTTLNIAPTYTQTTITSQGTRVTHILTAGTYDFSVNATPTASGSINAGVGYSAVVTTKVVTIDCGFGETFHKGPTGLPVSNITSQATPRYGDTWVDPGSLQPPLFDYYKVTPSFTAVPIGFWQPYPNHVWNAAGEPFSDTIVSTYTTITPTTWTITPAGLAKLGASGAKTYEVDLTLSDGGANGSSANATYFMRVHNPYDNWRVVPTANSIPDSFDPITPNTVAQPGYAFAGGTISCSWVEQDLFWTDMSSGISSATAVLSSTWENPLYNAIFALLGITEKQILPQANTGTASFDSCWNNGFSDIGGSWSDPQSLYAMTPFINIEYVWASENGDQYGQSGYVGTAFNLTAVKEAMAWGGHFTRYYPR